MGKGLNDCSDINLTDCSQGYFCEIKTVAMILHVNQWQSRKIDFKP